MHVLIAVLHRPSKPTGVCRHAANLARCLSDLPEISQVTLVTGAWQRYYFETAFTLSSPKIKIIDIAIQNHSINRNLWFLFGLPTLVSQLRPDLVHLTFPLPFWRSRFTCPVVATIHDLYPYEFPENFGRVQAIFNRFFLQQCIGQSDGLSCVSQETLKQLKLFFPEVCTHREVTVTYNSVDFSSIVPEPPDFYTNQENSPFLLSVAQHRKNKNLHLLIQSFANLLQTQKLDDAAELILVGSFGPETENLQRQIATLKLQARVRLLSSVSDHVLCWLYQHCSLYVVASSTEGFCIPLVEAKYLGAKVVCSDIPILREVGTDDCIYFSLDGEPVKNLEQAIVESIYQPSKDHLDKDLRFSQTTTANQYFQLYSRVMNRYQPSLAKR